MLRPVEVLLLASFVLWAPVFAQAAPDPQAPEAAEPAHEAAVTHAEGVEPDPAVDGIYRRFHEAYRSLEAGTVAATYDEDAYYLSPGAELRRGRGSVEEGFERLFGWARESGSRIDITFEIVERRLGADLGYDVGYFTLTRRQEDGSAAVNRGKFVVVLRPGEDGWRILVDSFSPVQQNPAGEGP